jgi:hypothetical protein
MMSASHLIFRRRRFLALMMAAPALFTALGVCAVEGRRVLQPQSPLFVAPFMFSLADAIEQNDVDQAHAFIRAGQDPNQPIGVSNPVLTGGRRVLVSPLLWAVATGRRDPLLMLLGYGARWDAAMGAEALCLAEQLGDGTTAALLQRHGARLDERCADRRRTDPPLVSFAADAGFRLRNAPDQAP